MNGSKVLLALFITILGFSFSAEAQKSRLLRANKEFEQLNYTSAIPMYLEILDKVDDNEAKANLAECYRKIGDIGESEYWYSQLVYLPDAKPVYMLYYGQALQQNGKCDLAKEWFKKYSEEAPGDGRAKLLSRTCDPDEMRRMITSRKKFYEVWQLPFNTQYDDFGATMYKGGLVFASERDNSGVVKRSHTWTGNPFLELFYTVVDTVNLEEFEFVYEREPNKFDNKLNTKFHDGPIAFTKDYQRVYITRNNFVEGKTGRDAEGVVRLKIVTADIVNGKWENIVELPFNSDEYSIAHPTLSPDGNTLYFASDMPGGFGGMDLYSTTMENGSWTYPMNLGPSVNTEGHEVFPFYHDNGKLFFSSNGHIGLGGLDMYFIEKIEGTWGPVMNIGAPLNSNADDFNLVLNENETFGYFSSDREGGVGNDDIYSFKQTVVEVELLVYDEKTGKPLANANVKDACNGNTYTTNANGKAMVEMAADECCRFIANQGDYEQNSKEACTTGKTAGSNMVVKIPLSKPEELEFVLAGLVFNSETGDPIPNATVTLYNDCGDAEISLTTDPSGKYEFILDKACCYSLKGEKDNYLASVPDANYCTKNQLKSRNFWQDLPLTPYVTNPEVFADNRNGEAALGTSGPGTSINFIIENIYYDFDEAYIREESFAPLNNIVKLMNDNPTLIVEIGSHTDARGSDRYNEYLSRRRAKAVREYLITNGVADNRLTYEGYGESVPTNDCLDEVPCSEEQHQRNRRTEFRVVGTLDGRTFERNSTAPKSIQVDVCNGCPF